MANQNKRLEKKSTHLTGVEPTFHILNGEIGLAAKVKELKDIFTSKVSIRHEICQ
jgi:hypothetical protein